MRKSIPTPGCDPIPAAQYVRMSDDGQQYSIDNHNNVYRGNRSGGPYQKINGVLRSEFRIHGSHGGHWPLILLRSDSSQFEEKTECSLEADTGCDSMIDHIDVAQHRRLRDGNRMYGFSTQFPSP
jgi:hypothetical protein